MISSSFVAQAIGSAASPEKTFSSVVTDSRKIVPGCLFVALKGDNFDAHDFIPQAVAKGATGVLCRKGTPAFEALRFEADDTLQAYRALAGAWRRRFSIPVIAVAGSNGKTTTKEILTALLRGRFSKVLKTEGSQNGFVGIAMTLLELRPEHEVAVIEVGIDEIGAMAQHLSLVRPDAAVLTAIGPEHLERLRDLPTVAAEEGIALTHVAESGGLVVVNLDDHWIAPYAQKVRALGKGRLLTFSLKETGPEATHLSGKVSADSATIRCSGAGVRSAEFTLPLPGKHNAANFLAAAGLAAGLGLGAEEITRGLATFQGAPGRSQVRELPGKTPVLCDYYNANPSSTEAGLELISELASRAGKKRPRWCCLGDMLELGPEEEKFHRGLAPKITALGIEHVLLYGPRMRALENELRKSGFAGEVAHFESHAALAGHLTTRAQPGHAILIKGSRGMRMEEVWKLLEPHAAAHWSTAQ